MELRRYWLVVLGAFLGTMAGGACTFFYSAGLFVKPMAEEFGWSRAQASLGSLLALLTFGLSAPFLGRLIDRLGAVRLGLLSLLGLSAAFAALALLTASLASFLVLVAVLALVSCASTPVGFTRPVILTFDKQRGLALGLTWTGVGVGAFLVPMLLGPVIETRGWRAGYLALAGAVLVCVPVVALLFKLGGGTDARPPAQTDAPAPSPATTLRNPELWKLFALFVFASLGVFGSIVHLTPMLTDNGYALTDAARIASLMGAAVVGGRVIAGALLDRWDARRLTSTLLAGSSAGLFLLATEQTALVAPGALLLGFAIGVEIDLLAYLVSRTFSKAHYSLAFGVLYAACAVGGASSPPIAGAVRDMTGSYVLWQISAGLALLIAAGIALTLRRPKDQGDGL
jgi:predicted MFS family arabinose efflux permease